MESNKEKVNNISLEQKIFEKKWSKKIRDTLEVFRDKTINELYEEFDKLKEQMKKEADKKGIKLET